jgi:hypothetical protein
MTEKGTYVNSCSLSYNIYILNNSNYNSYKHFANMKGTIYGNWLPRGTQVK